MLNQTVNQPKEKINTIPTRTETSSASLGPTKHHETVILPFCKECDPNDHCKENRKMSDSCTTCKISFDNLTNAQRALLHWHNKLDHMGFTQLKDLAKRGYLPPTIATAQKVICPACQQGKAIKITANKDNKIVKDTVVINPGDLIHMDQAESSTPGRPLTHSGKNNKRKILVVSLFVDSISKKIFCEFQDSTGAEETIKAKRNEIQKIWNHHQSI